MDGVTLTYKSEVFFGLPRGDVREVSLERCYAYEFVTSREQWRNGLFSHPLKREVVYESKSRLTFGLAEDGLSRYPFKVTLQNDGAERDGEMYMAFNAVDRIAGFIGWPERLAAEIRKRYEIHWIGDSLSMTLDDSKPWPVIHVHISNPRGLLRYIELNYETPQARQQFMAFARHLQLLSREAHPAQEN